MEGGRESFLMNKDRQEAGGGGEGSQKQKQNQTAFSHNPASLSTV